MNTCKDQPHHSNSSKDDIREPGLRKHSCGKNTTAQVLDEAQPLHRRTQKPEQTQKPMLRSPQDPKFKNPFGPINQDSLCIPNINACEPVLVKADQGHGLETKAAFGQQQGCPALELHHSTLSQIMSRGIENLHNHFSLPKRFKHTLFCILFPNFIFILRIGGTGRLTQANHTIQDFKRALFHNFVTYSTSNTCIFLRINTCR